MNLRKYISLFKDAITGLDYDYTKGNIDKAIFLLAVPMIFEMVMESLFIVVDIYFVSKIGVNAVTVVGLTESIFYLVESVAIGLSMGITAIVARRIGEKNPEKATEAAVQSIYLAIFFSLFFTLAGIFFHKQLLRLMGAPEDIITMGSTYTWIMLVFNISCMLIFMLNASFRGAGLATIAMRSLWIANGINIFLVPMLIYGVGPLPELGVAGAAVATNIGRGSGVVYQLWALFKKRNIFIPLKHHFKINIPLQLQFISLGVGGAGQFLISTASWIFLMRIMSHFGPEAVTAHTLTIRIIVFSLLPAWGIANAAATLVGQNLGANNPERAEQSVWKTIKYVTAFFVCITLLYFITADSIIALFNDNPQVIALGTQGLKIMSIGYLFYGAGMVFVQAFNGAGDTRTPIIVNIICFWIIQIPLAYYISIYLDWGPVGVFYTIIISQCIMTLLTAYIFKRGKWKTQMV